MLFTPCYEHLISGAGRQSTAAFGRILRIFRVNWWLLFVAQCLARQWIHVLRQFLCVFERISRIFYVKEDTRILKSILSCSPASGDMENCAQSMLQSPFTWQSLVRRHVSELSRAGGGGVAGSLDFRLGACVCHMDKHMSSALSPHQAFSSSCRSVADLSGETWQSRWANARDATVGVPAAEIASSVHAPSRPYDGSHGAGDGLPPQRSTFEVKSGGGAE